MPSRALLILTFAALKSFSRHTWYLPGEMIPLALWDEDISPEEKDQLAASLVCATTDNEITRFMKRFGTGFSKPELPHIKTGQKLSLSHFVTADSHMFSKFFQSQIVFLPILQHSGIKMKVTLLVVKLQAH